MPKVIKTSPEYNNIVENLKKRVMTMSQLCDLLHYKRDSNSCNRVNAFIMAIGIDYAVYEPYPGAFKILTDSDLEEYRTEYYRMKRQKELIHGKQ